MISLAALHAQVVYFSSMKDTLPSGLTILLLALVAFMAEALFLSPIARADAPAPDTSTPKKAAMAFAKAVDDDDMEAVHSLAIGNDAEFAVIKELGKFEQASHRLSVAANKKFNKQGNLSVEDAYVLQVLSKHLFSEFEAGQEKIEGDQATLVIAGKGAPLTLKKDGNGWKLDLGFLEQQGLKFLQKSQTIPMTVKAYDVVTKNVEADKYKTLREVLADVKPQIIAQVEATATRPSTEPTTMPSGK
jgi:hypothetical protein